MKIDLKGYLLAKDKYLDEENLTLYFDRLKNLINEEQPIIRYSIDKCHKAYCKSLGIEPTHETLADFMAFIIELGLTRHILKNIQNFEYYGYAKELQEVENESN